MRINKAHFPVTTLGYGRRLGLWVQGCSIGCKGCVSRDTWDADGGWEVDAAQVIAWCEGRRGGPRACVNGIDGITISGGEPFEQPEALTELLEALDSWRQRCASPFDILCYSGLPLRRLKRRHAYILGLLDALIPEPYVDRRDAAASPRSLWRGSSNQPLVPLTALGRERYGDDSAATENAPRIQVSIEHGALWFIGIPRPGDMERLEDRARARGVVMEDVSWRA